jgi:oxygen-independent coproporphyrinogen III oxidase
VALTPALLAEDSLIFGLRMNEGVDVADLRRRFPGGALAVPWRRSPQRLVEDGLALRTGERLSP